MDGIHTGTQPGEILQGAVDCGQAELAKAAYEVAEIANVFLVQKTFNGNANSEEALAYTCALVNLIEKLKQSTTDWSLQKKLHKAADLSASWLRPFFEQSPEKRKAFSDYIQTNTANRFPWEVARPAPTSLALLYNFSPFQDTGATVASKRLRDFSETFDVIACSFLHKKKQDNTVELIAEPYVASKYFLQLPPSWASWEPFKAFAIRSSKYAQKKHALHQYERVYSRAMWAPSLYVGYMFKRNNPQVEWVAEFSDPLSLDVEGKSRGTTIPDDDFSRMLTRDLAEKYPRYDSSVHTVFSLPELLVYAFADKIIFTNSHQYSTMVNSILCPELRQRVEERAVISNHPTLPRGYYTKLQPALNSDENKLNLGYFGEFYSSRSIREVTSAIRSLPKPLRERVHLYVFTNYIPATEGNRRPRNFSKKQYEELVKRAYDGVGAEGIEEHVTFNASLPFLEFLATTDKLDYLIVNDAQSGPHHNVNPYLPSKWSDYNGSTADTWAFVEENSILSGKPATVKTPVGDAYEARVSLWEMILDKFPTIQMEV